VGERVAAVEVVVVVLGVAANFAVADSAGRTAGVFENYSETQNYLVDENSKDGLYYLES
tara:strand:+ start:538 stop:714 length:177 start_codon:yes stop_codon:yes gene_type:complete